MPTALTSVWALFINGAKNKYLLKFDSVEISRIVNLLHSITAERSTTICLSAAV
ncbi:hypothetical protein HMPREF3208_00342 [Gardnerella vaginalis]|uniref:Uncharacterized protein n=1 Tax=Gardnerella vaginalis TaxID=2702 RepID=A0A133P178_GARVA|nr:hypothetical protein HMPREF3208_00342 [Gardnerella vaginalis]